MIYVFSDPLGHSEGLSMYTASIISGATPAYQKALWASSVYDRLSVCQLEGSEKHDWIKHTAKVALAWLMEHPTEQALASTQMDDFNTDAYSEGMHF